MARIGGSRINDAWWVLWLLAALALLMLIHVSASLAGEQRAVRLDRVGRDLAAVRVQLAELPDRFIETAIGTLSFNAELGNGDGAHRWRTAMAMAESAERGAKHVRRALELGGASEPADLALLLSVQLSNVQRAIASWREASSLEEADAALERARDSLDRADEVFALLGANVEARRPRAPAPATAGS